MGTQIKLTMEQRAELSRIISHTLSDFRSYFIHAIRNANRQGNLSDKIFWRNLFISESAKQQNNVWVSNKSDPFIRRGQWLAEQRCYPDQVPDNPYGMMDIQMCLKYLIFSGSHVIRWNNGVPEFVTDSDHFFRYMKIDSAEKKGYCVTCDTAKNIRNATSHETEAAFKKMNLKRLISYTWTLRQLMDPFQFLKDLGELKPVETRFHKMNTQIREQLNGFPVSISELCDLAAEYSSSEADTKARTTHIQTLLSMADFTICDHFVIATCEPDLLTQAVIAFLQNNPGAPTEQDVQNLRLFIHPQPNAQPKEEPPKPVVQEKKVCPVSSNERSLLEKCGKLLPVDPQTVAALLSGFLVTADESIFLCAEGRRLLTALLPILQELKLQLQVDYSVVSSLYTKYQRSKELLTNPQELFDDFSQFSNEELEFFHKQQTQLNDYYKLALKALRMLRINNCLLCISSAVPTASSFENICQVAKTYPNTHFLVLTMKRQLAESLGAIPSGNAIAAKVTMNDKLLLFSDTFPAWQQALGLASPAEDPLRRAARGARVLKAVDASGNSSSVALEQKLGEGGEGIVYLTSHSDDLVAKIYHPDKIDATRREKLEYMVNHNPQISNLAWPCALLYEDGDNWVGYLMPKAPGKVLDDVVFHPGYKWNNIRDMGWSRRHLAQICANIAHTFAQMHRKQMLMGDVNPRNIVVDRDCRVYFVDCDSYQFAHYECPVGKPDYTPPEVHKRMREEGITEYRYIRTEYNEMYSLAVLLFSTLLPGRAPYASRNAGFDDVVDAVIAGLFPFRLDGSTDNLPVNMMAPAGVFRNIWSHTTHDLKVHFFETFTETGRGRRSAAQWETAMRDYIRVIERDHTSDELAPKGYKDISKHGKESATKMLELVCAHCGETFNIAEDVYQRRQGRFEQNFCGTHFQMMRNFRQREEEATCTRCGKAYITTKYDIHVRDALNKPMICDDCEYEHVPCAVCGTVHRQNRDKIAELRMKGRAILCRDCRPQRD